MKGVNRTGKGTDSEVATTPVRTSGGSVRYHGTENVPGLFIPMISSKKPKIAIMVPEANKGEIFLWQRGTS